ncbi:MAG: AI-2E family transporter [Clostridia bacterium]|nr:AI-2E family transporter [Clostridia bacterium]
MELNSKNIKKILILVFFSAIIVCGVFNMSSVFGFVSKLYSFISPIIAAFCIAFVFNVLLNALENKVFFFMDKAKRKFVQKMKRPVCLILTYVLAFGLISLLVLVIIPDIIDTVFYLVKNLPAFLESAREWLVDFAARFNIPESKVPTINLDFAALTGALQEIFSAYSNNIVDGAIDITSSVVGGVYDTLFSIIISIYILAQKERIGGFVKSVINSFLPNKTANGIYHLASHASNSFSRFIGGQLTEAVILGVLCYIGMLIFRFPNAPIISVLIAVTSLVPVVGAFTGVAIGFLLILITNPIKALFFIVFILVLQQIEGNLIYPRVVGKAVGLPAVIVISAVLVGGNVGGILGALIGVPVSALLYTLLKEAIQNRKSKTIKAE